jgi:hypothetical protein
MHDSNAVLPSVMQLDCMLSCSKKVNWSLDGKMLSWHQNDVNFADRCIFCNHFLT